MANKKILIPVAISTAVLLILFFIGINGLSVPTPKSAQKPKQNVAVKAADFDSLLQAEKNKLHPQVLGEINNMESELANAADDQARAELLDKIGRRWLELNKPLVGAKFISESGFLDNSEKKLTFASHLMNKELHDMQDAGMREWMADLAERSLNKILEVDPHNVDAKMELATLYIEGKGMPMQGVAQLQEIVGNDSANFQANLVLGKMAIESNQLDRALDRAQLILRYHPDSWEARILMAEAYLRQGDKANAEKYLLEAKKWNTDPAFGKDVDQYINNIK